MGKKIGVDGDRIRGMFDGYCREVKMMREVGEYTWVAEEEVLDLIEYWIRTDKEVVLRCQDSVGDTDSAEEDNKNSKELVVNP